MTRLPELTWRPRAASLVGCLEGIAGYLGVGASPAWIAAAVGQADETAKRHERDDRLQG